MGITALKTVAPIDFALIAAYMLLMLGIGFYAMRFNRGAADYFKGGNRIHWLAAGLSSFMSGFSAWTFTGAAGLAYQHGLVAVLLYVGNACTFLLGYFIFAARWRRARISTVMEYLVDRFDERTRQTFSWGTIFFQFFTGASMLYGLALFVAPACGWPLSWTIVGSGAVILAYCVVGGLWAVVITDFLQAAILMPFTLVMGWTALSRVGGLHGLLSSLPQDMTTLHLSGEFGWSYVLCWTVMTSFGYNTAAMAQRYFSVDDEASAKKIALLCFGLFLVGAAIWFVPPLAMRVLHPDLRGVWPGLKNPQESSYALAALSLLPNGLVGIMLAAMFSATMSSISGVLNLHASIISRDIFPALFPKRAGDAEKLVVAWASTLGVGIIFIVIALVMASSGLSVFSVLVQFNTVMSLAYGPPALLGLVVRRTPSWSGLVSFVVGLVLGSYATFVASLGLVATVLIVVPASVAAFVLTRFLGEDSAVLQARQAAFFKKLDTPVDVVSELGDGPDPTAQVFRFLSRATGLVGLASLFVLLTAGPEDRPVVLGYAALTLVLAACLALIRGGPARAVVRAAAVVVLVGSAGRPAEAGVRSIWAVGDGEKIDQTRIDSPLAALNSVWDGKTVRLFAARNEIVAFQVIVVADAKGIGALSAALPRLAGTTEKIVYAAPAVDPTLSVGRPIQLFSMHYLNVTKATKADWAWKPGPAAPRDPLGSKPVVLVPENARAGRGGFPLRVEADRTQSIWIEVDTGRSRAAGVYRGNVVLTADGQSTSLPVELEVLDFALPDENSLRAMIYYEPDQPVLYHGKNLDPAYHRFAHRQRVELVSGYSAERVRASLGRFDGKDFTRANGYEGPGEGVGNTIVPASFYGPGPEYEERGSAWKASDAWMEFVAKTVPKALTFLYLPDEPYPQQYPHVRKLAENLRSNPGPGGRLPTFVTKEVIPELEGAIDIWCVPPQAYDIAKAEGQRLKGRRVWFYNGGRPQGPTLLIDAPATDARVVAWAAFKHDVDVYFYWHGVHWRHNRQKQGERRQNVWVDPITFDNRGQPKKPVDDQGYLNGDGVLMYPGEENVHPQEDRGLAGPCSTVQLANLRRGLQDHQYLTLARQLGLTAEVAEALRSVVPRVFSDAGPSVGFAETGETFEAARRKLATAIAAKKKATAR
jgi:SSS family transporter